MLRFKRSTTSKRAPSHLSGISGNGWPLAIPRRIATGDRLVLPADQHNAGKADYLGNELGLLPKGVGDNRCQTKPCCERRDRFEPGAGSASPVVVFGLGCVDYRAGRGKSSPARPAPSSADQLPARCQPLTT